MSVPISVKRRRGAQAEAGSPTLRIGGVTPFSASDYPGQLAAVVFVQGCPWRCGYCHNPHLQPRPAEPPLSWSSVRALLQRRIGLIDAVVFSGGEPTLDAALPDAMREVRDMGYRIGLHSGGIYPEALAEALPLADWVGLDVKAPFDLRYDRITRTPGSAAAAMASLRALLASGVRYECRTTVHPALLTLDDMRELARELAALGVAEYAVQMFRPQGCARDELKALGVAPFPAEALLEEISGMFTSCTLRKA
jgi:pyruvate formate lyase activating enzyme